MMFLNSIYVMLAVVFLFSITIFVHELGHFLAARLFGMVVDTFSIGFGPALWKKKKGDITYKIGAVPVGGYVALPQIDPASTEDSKKDGAEQDADKPARVLPPVAPWKKMIVIASGAAGNMLLAVALAWLVYWIGKPSAPSENSTQIGFVAMGSEAYEVGIRPGDEILAVNGTPVGNWQEMMERAMHHEKPVLTIGAAEGERDIPLSTVKGAVGIKTIPGIEPIGDCTVYAVSDGMSAESAGIRPGDLIKTFNNNRVYSIPHLTQLVDDARDMDVPVEVLRNGELLALTVRPAFEAELGRAIIGVRFGVEKVLHIPPGEQIKRHATAIFRVLGMLLDRETSKTTAQGLGGPVMIIYVFQDVVRQGLGIALWFTCFINVNLAILNLLPIPVLDGGHLVFCLWELVTRRRVHPKVFQWVTQVFAVLLIGVFVLLTFKDTKLLLTIYGVFGFSGNEALVEDADIKDSPSME